MFDFNGMLIKKINVHFFLFFSNGSVKQNEGLINAKNTKALGDNKRTKTRMVNIVEDLNECE